MKVIFIILSIIFMIFSFKEFEFYEPVDSVVKLISDKIPKEEKLEHSKFFISINKNSFLVKRKKRGKTLATTGRIRLVQMDNKLKLSPMEMETEVEKEFKLLRFINKDKGNEPQETQNLIKEIFKRYAYKNFYIIEPKKVSRDSVMFRVYLGVYGFVFGLFLLLMTYSKEISLFFIYVYQRYISPKKGFRCANAAIKGVDSCSEAVRKVTKDKGFIAGLKEYRRTTKECRKTYEEYQDRKNANNCLISSFAFDSCSILGGAAEAGASACEAGACACDVGAC